MTTEIITLCDYAITSKDGKLSILGIFDRIFVTATPARYPRFFVVIVVKGEPTSTHQFTLKLKNPSGTSILPPKKIDITFGANGKANIITDVANLNLDSLGEYTFSLDHHAKSIASTPLFISQLTPPSSNLN